MPMAVNNATIVHYTTKISKELFSLLGWVFYKIICGFYISHLWLDYEQHLTQLIEDIKYEGCCILYKVESSLRQISDM